MKNVCLFGIFDLDYSRNKILIAGFQANGIQPVVCNVDPRKNVGIKKYYLLYQEYIKIRKTKFDVVIVGFPGQGVVWMAKLLFWNTPIVFDAFLSLYDSNVYDRKMYSKFSIRAIKDYLLDLTSCLLSDVILLDTDQHILYFVKTFHIRIDKFIRLPIGAEEHVFFPQQKKETFQKFIVHFHGNFIPLQGIKYIVGAAERLKNENTIFSIVGSGQEFPMIEKMVTELGLREVFVFQGRKKIEEIPHCISESDLCLGIFGDTEKTQRVVPNKVYECMAMGKPVLTADTPAIRELLPVGRGIAVCKVADGDSLARAIRHAKQHKKEMDLVGKVGYDYFVEHFSHKKMIAQLITDLKQKI